MEARELANRFVDMFGGVDKAKEYVVLWQDEYNTEEERLFRQELKYRSNG